MAPLDRTIAATILLIGQFRPWSWPADKPLDLDALAREPPNSWFRDILEEQCSVRVELGGANFEASIQPSISTFDHHHGKRITAGVYFEICAKYAEKVGGEIVQKATVTGCKPNDALNAGLVLARYPDEPMMWDHICMGFRQELLP